MSLNTNKYLFQFDFDMTYNFTVTYRVFLEVFFTSHCVDQGLTKTFLADVFCNGCDVPLSLNAMGCVDQGLTETFLADVFYMGVMCLCPSTQWLVLTKD